MVDDLFEQPCDPGFHYLHDFGDAWLREYPFALDGQEAQRCLRQLQAEVPWSQDSIRIAGREILVPRLQCWMGDPGTDYGYSGISLTPQPWTETVLKLRQRVFERTGHGFNSVLLNYYRNGQDSVAWHADDERELGPNPVIASVSLGAERPFQFRHKRDSRAARHRLLLRSGSVLLMGETLQNNWVHQLPKVRGLAAPRINLTFRNIQVTGNPG